MSANQTYDFEFRNGSRKMPYKILDSRRIGETIIVIYNYMEFSKRKQAHNLVAYNLDGKELWTAEHPTSMATDCYVNFMSEDPLWIGNFAGFKCQIDLKTGKLTQAVFTK